MGDKEKLQFPVMKTAPLKLNTISCFGLLR